MPLVPCVLALLCLALLARPAPLAAEDPPPGEASPLCLFHLGALTQGRSDFFPPRVGQVPPDRVSDALQPLFGGESEEPTLPAGNADEILEQVRTLVDPASWDADGAWIRTLQGRHLLVRSPAGARAGVGAYLQRLEERWLRPLAVDVVAVRLAPDAPAAPTSAALAALVVGADAGPGLTLAGLPGQRVVGFAGRQQSFLADYDVEVASKSTISDPIVGVLSTGLSVGCRATPSDDGTRVRVGNRSGLPRVEASLDLRVQAS